MLTVNQLSKKFGNIEAVKNVSFHVEKGSTFAFLGTNGAGKSTVIHMLIGLLKADAGAITYTESLGPDVTGVVFQSHRLDDALSIEENLLVRARLYGLSKKTAKRNVYTLLKLTNLYEKRKRLYGQCSGGEKRKADIIRALVHHPKLLILDEPTTGLDAESREEIWELLHRLKRERKLTIFLTTHYIEEVDDADYVVMMHEGTIEIEGTPTELRNRYSKVSLILHTEKREEVKRLLHAYPSKVEMKNNNISITIESSKFAIPILQEVEAMITDFSIQEASLERVFLQMAHQVKGRGVK